MDSASNIRQTTGMQGMIAGSFTKMNQAKYLDYLQAHQDWIVSVESVDQQLHSQALRRRAVEKLVEKTTIPDFATAEKTVGLPGFVLADGTGAKLSVKLEAKVEHKPTLSTKPHQAELRSEKKKLEDARVKRQVNAVKARAAVVETETPEVIQARMAAIHKLKVVAPLHKQEEVAAKSAAARSKQIRIGSIDLATNVDPESWQVVTRKKGSQLVRGASFVTDNELGKMAVDVDPSMVQAGRAFTAAIRKPQATLVK